MKFNWGHGIMLFLALFVLASVAFIVFSFKQKNDLVTKDYYKLGADYTSQMIINQRSMPYVDSIGFVVGENDLQIVLSPTIANEIDSIWINFFRPSNKELDYNCVLPVKVKQARLEKENLTNGRYMVNVEWTLNGDLFQVQKEVFIK